eukprot:6211970-Pleurochrysis_carterae.AAC.9
MEQNVPAAVQQSTAYRRGGAAAALAGPAVHREQHPQRSQEACRPHDTATGTRFNYRRRLTLQRCSRGCSAAGQSTNEQLDGTVRPDCRHFSERFVSAAGADCCSHELHFRLCAHCLQQASHVSYGSNISDDGGAVMLIKAWPVRGVAGNKPLAGPRPMDTA